MRRRKKIRFHFIKKDPASGFCSLPCCLTSGKPTADYVNLSSLFGQGLKIAPKKPILTKPNSTAIRPA
jgi:hypothetical protein